MATTNIKKQLKDFEKAKPSKGRILKPGAVNRTLTSFTAKSLTLHSQDLSRAHLFVTSQTSKSSVSSGEKGHGESKQINHMDIEPKEWRAMIRLACSHAGHHSGKTRLDAAERLKRLLFTFTSGSSSHFDATSVLPLIVDTVIRGWCDDSKEVRQIFSGLIHFTWTTDQAKAEKGLLVALTHVRTDSRLSARCCLLNLLNHVERNPDFMATGFGLFRNIWNVIDNLLVNMKPIETTTLNVKSTDAHQLIPSILQTLLCNQDSREPYLVYEWRPTQDIPLCIIRQKSSDIGLDQGRISSVITAFLEKTKILFYDVDSNHGIRQKVTDDTKRAKKYLREVLTIIQRIAPRVLQDAIPKNKLDVILG